MPAGRLPPLARAMREHAQVQLGEDHPISLDETLDRAQGGALTRRELLKIVHDPSSPTSLNPG